MRAPTAHQVENLRVLGYLFLEELADGGDGPFVYMDNQAWHLVEDSVVLFIVTLEIFGGKIRFGDGGLPTA